MKFNVASLLKGPTGSRRDLQLEENIRGIDEDIEATAPLTGEVRLTRTSDGILASVALHTEVKISCRRCLCAFVSPVDLAFDEIFYPSIDVNTGVALPMEDVDPALRIDERHMLDITEVVRQHIILQREQYPLCDEACAGLCVTCGKNLNEGPCGCQDVSEDPRWAALRELLK
ncbi:MAG: YceD family protein [Anaerolineae bacterium]